MNSCIHCSLPCNENEEFCCNGCNAAYQLINDSGFGKYYNQRIFDNNSKILKPDNENDNIDYNDFIIENNLCHYQMSMLIDGLHCAACVWLIESILIKQENVEYARINMSTKRLTLTWRDNREYGNDLVKLIHKLGYKLTPYDPKLIDEENIKKEKYLLKAIAVSGFASGNIMTISLVLWTGNDMGAATRDLLHLLSAIIAIPTVIYAGMYFYKSAFNALKSGRTNMDVPISVGIILTTIMSIIETVLHGKFIYYEAAVSLVFFLLIGRFLDLRVRTKAKSVAHDLLIMLSGSTVQLLPDGTRNIIANNKIIEGMILIFGIGDKITADGIVIAGESQLDYSAVSGEIIPKDVESGDEVFAGTVNLTQPITIKVNKAGENTMLAEIIRMMEHAQQHKVKFMRISDMVARLFTPVVHILAIGTFLGWLIIGGVSWSDALLYAVTVLIITCPCGLGLAVPAVLVVATSSLFRSGIITKSGDILEKLNKINHIIFDKTGTLTYGKPVLIDANKYDKQIMQIASSLAIKSKHPLSKAICESYFGPLLNLDVNEYAGLGLETIIDKKSVKFGSARFIDVKDDSNLPTVYLSYDNKITIFRFADILREDAKNVISNLKNQYKITILSGDRPEVVANIAKELDINNYYAQMLPINKQQYIINSQKSGDNILMVGDGINDAPSLVSANASMSPATASDISQISSDIIFQNTKLQSVQDILHIAKKANILIKENIAFSLIYNIIAVPLAIAGKVTPLIAAIVMASSSIIVILNSLRAKK
jgi:P-type Cu2+ transporter